MAWGKEKKTYTTGKGYLRYKDSKKYVHRAVAEKKLGRPLPKGAVVHHVNENKQDNRPSNLKVYSSQKQHMQAHRGFFSWF